MRCAAGVGYMIYSGCHKYVPFARFPNKRNGSVQQFGIIIKEDNRYIRAFASGHIGGYRQPGEDTTNHRYRNVILTNALA
jgi:hypothetical protein